MSIRTPADLMTFAAEHGINQSELAQALGVGKSTITEDRQDVPEDTFEILDEAPERITRPLGLVGGKAYAVTWIHTRRTIHRDEDGNRLETPRQVTTKVRVVLDARGRMYASEPVPGCTGLSKLGVDVTCDDPVPDRSAWSGKGVARYCKGDRPSPADVFKAVKTVVGHFMSFEYSFAPQEQMEELIACKVIGTYMLPAFNTASYGWSHAELGAGKTRLLEVIAEVAYLGLMCLNSTTLAMMRDIAAYGGTLCFDDVEGLTGKGADPDKQALLLAGNRKGVMVGFKDKDPETGKWTKTFVEVYCTRWFSATTTPIGTLASRTIFFPLVASSDKAKTDREPMEGESWPPQTDRRTLVDDLFALALTNLPALPAYDRKAAGLVSESGRKLQPWRVPLGVALWLQERGVEGVFERLVQTMRAYHRDALTQALSVHQTIIPRALRRMWDARAAKDAEAIVFSAGDLWGHVNAIADEEELSYDDQEGFISMKSLGHRLRKLRLPHTEERNSRRKLRTLERSRLEQMEAAIAQPEPEPCTHSSPLDPNGRNGRNGTNGTNPEPGSADCADCADCAERVLWEEDSTQYGSGSKVWRVNGEEVYYPWAVSAETVLADHPGATCEPVQGSL